MKGVQSCRESPLALSELLLAWYQTRYQVPGTREVGVGETSCNYSFYLIIYSIAFIIHFSSNELKVASMVLLLSI